MPLDVMAAFLISLLYLAMASVLDLFNNKNIPDNLAFLLLLSSLIFSLSIYGLDIFIFALAQAAFLLLAGYLLYRSGVMGLADPIFFAVVALLLPYVPGLPFKVPFILPALIYAGVVFALFSSIYYGYKVFKKGIGKLNYTSFLIAISYLIFLYFSPPIINPLLIALLGIISIAATFVGLFSDDIKEVMSSSISVDLAEEEVLADKNPEKVLEIASGKKVLDRELIEQLKKAGIKKVVVYSGMLPFLPFLLGGVVLSFLYGASLFF